MSLLPGNTKSFENIRNKRSNLLQKATQRGHTLYDVLRDEITKAGGCMSYSLTTGGLGVNEFIFSGRS